MRGRYCRLEPLSADAHGPALFRAYRADREGRIWTYLAYGPFDSEAAYRAWIERDGLGPDPLFYAVIDGASGRPGGVASYLRVKPAMGTIELGHICYAPALQRTRAGSEAMYLMLARAFELGYRRLEWKCDALNGASRRAAGRLGFRFEGVFRQHMVTKGRNRDTAWYAVIDRDWPALAAAFRQWLDPANFDSQGRQRRALTDLTRPLTPERG